MEQLKFHKSRRGWSLIHHTVFKNYFPRVRKLCQSFPEEMEARTALEGYTPLLVAAMAGSLESFMILLQAGANDSAISFQEETAVQLAASLSHSQLLIKAMMTTPFSPERVMHEMTTHLNRQYTRPVTLTNTLAALADILNHLSTTEQLKEHLVIPVILVETVENVLKRIVREKMILPATPICKVIEAIIPMSLQRVVESKILPMLLNMTEAICNEKVVLQVLTVISKAVYHSSDADEVLDIISGPKPLIDILEIHTTKESQLVLMDCIAYSGRSKKIRESLTAKPETMKVFVDTLSGTKDTKVLVSTANALMSLIDGSLKTRECLIQLGTVEAILKVLNPSNKLASEQAIKLLRKFCIGDGVVERIVEVDPKAISILLYYAGHSSNIKLQQISFDILCLITANSLVERKAMASALGPECLLSLFEYGSKEVQVLALETLLPLTQPFHSLQAEVIEAGALMSLVNTIQNNEDCVVRALSFRALGNLSCKIANKPNHHAQGILVSINGVQLLARVASRGCNCSEHAMCTLSSFSIKNRSIRRALLHINPNLVSDLLLSHQKTDSVPSERKSRTLCNLAYGCVEMQSQMISHGGMLLGSFFNQMNVSSQYQKADTAFQIVVLARVFTDSKQSEATLFGLKYLISALRASTAEGDNEVLMHVTAQISGLLLMRAGIADALMSLGIVSLAISMLTGKNKDLRRVAAVTLCLLTNSPHAAREILRECRRNPKLCCRMTQYGCGMKPSLHFTDNWELFCKTNSLSGARYVGKEQQL